MSLSRDPVTLQIDRPPLNQRHSEERSDEESLYFFSERDILSQRSVIALICNRNRFLSPEPPQTQADHVSHDALDRAHRRHLEAAAPPRANRDERLSCADREVRR
jgi:hypothetical protein